MKTKGNLEFHKRSKDDIRTFIKKLEFQALETAEEQLPLSLEVGLKDAKLIKKGRTKTNCLMSRIQELLQKIKNLSFFKSSS